MSERQSHAGINFKLHLYIRRWAFLFLLFAHDEVSQGPWYETSPAEFSSGVYSVPLPHLLTLLTSIFSFFFLVPENLAYNSQVIKSNPITRSDLPFGRRRPLHLSSAREAMVKILVAPPQPSPHSPLLALPPELSTEILSYLSYPALLLFMLNCRASTVVSNPASRVMAASSPATDAAGVGGIGNLTILPKGRIGGWAVIRYANLGISTLEIGGMQGSGGVRSAQGIGGVICAFCCGFIGSKVLG